MDGASRKEEEDAVRERAGERFQYRQRNSSYDEPRVIFFRLPPSYLSAPFSTAALPDSSNARFFTFVSVLSLLLSSSLSSSSYSFASLNLSHLPI